MWGSRHFFTPILWVCLSTYGMSAASQSAEGQAFTLADAVREALANSDRMLNENDSVEQAALGVRLARDSFRPKLVPNVQGSFGQTNVANQNYRLDLSQRFVTGTEMRVGVGTTTMQIPAQSGMSERDIHFYNADTTLTLSQPLLRSFGTNATRRPLTSAEVRRDEALRRRTMAEQAIVVDVAAAYYRIVAQQALVDVATRSLDRARELQEASEARLAAGLVSQLDVLRAQQLVSQAELQLLDAQAAVEDGRDELRLRLGRTSVEPFEVVSVIPRNVEVMPADGATATALERRLDLQSAQLALADANGATAALRSQLLPQLDMNLALTRRATAPSLGSSFGVDRFQLATFFTISMPVDRTPQLVVYENALIDRDRRRREIETLRRTVAVDVTRAVRDVQRQVRNLTAAEANVGIGRREVEVAQLRYERGLSNNLDVVTAETNLLNTEGRRISALADLAVAQLALRATIGTLSPAVDIDTAAGTGTEPASASP